MGGGHYIEFFPSAATLLRPALYIQETLEQGLSLDVLALQLSQTCIRPR